MLPISGFLMVLVLEERQIGNYKVRQVVLSTSKLAKHTAARILGRRNAKHQFLNSTNSCVV